MERWLVGLQFKQSKSIAGKMPFQYNTLHLTAHFVEIVWRRKTMGPKKNQLKESSRAAQIEQARQQDQVEREAFPFMTGKTIGQQTEEFLHQHFEWEDKIERLLDHDD